MGVFSALATLPKLFRGGRRGQDPFTTSDRIRACRVERLEDRRLMAFDVAPLDIGMVYREQGSGTDEVGDKFEITFKGGAPGTQLNQITINTDKLGDGLTIGDVFFDTAPGGQGSFNSDPFKHVSSNGIDDYDVTVSDGGTLLTINFQGFDVGEKFVFTIDVDEAGFIGSNAVAEGNEFEGSVLTGKFSAPTFEDAVGQGMFFDAYDNNFAGKGLDLPPDNYVPPGTVPDPVYTAGAIASLKQVPKPITLSGTVFEDVNLNNNREAGDNGIANVSLSLEEFDGEKYVTTGKTTLTDANGAYKFTGLLPGKYRVVETQPANLFSVGAKVGDHGGNVVTSDIIAEINLVGGDDAKSYDFAEAKPATLSGHVFHDANNNGHRDPGEEGIANVNLAVQYFPTGGGQAPDPIIVETDENGLWTVTGLRPGTYGVAEVQPAGWLDGLEAAGNKGGTANNPGDSITAINLLSGDSGINYDFGELLPSSITGQIHADLDGDCMYDTGEPLLSGVTVKLYDESGTLIDTTQTDAQGKYTFNGLAPGKYTVEEVQPNNYYQGGSSVGNSGGTAIGFDKLTGITLVSGTAATDYNFCEMVPASISGKVHADLDGDCMYDDGEPLLQGVKIWLLDANGTRIRSTVTDANGEYSFTNLEPGTYGVEEEQPANYYQAGSSVGTAGGQLVGTDKIIGATLGSGVNATDYDFCEAIPASISGMIHADLNGDCIYDDNEPLLEGVTVWLLDGNGTRIRSTVTDEHGEYSFTNLAPGTYGVEEVQPNGYYQAGSSVGNSGGQLVGTDKILGVTLGSGVAATNYNFCELLPASISGVIHADRDGDCVYDEGEPLLAGVTVWLLDANGTRLRSTVTNANGEYEFTNLNPGTYGIEEVQPNGYFDSGNMLGSAGGQILNDNNFRQIVLGSGVNATDYNFCEEEPASLCGVVYVDADGDGVRDVGEVGIAGVKMYLLDANGIPTGMTVITAADGSYCFMGLKPGTYGVAEDQPAGYFDGTETVGDAGGQANPGDSITGAILPPAKQAKNYNFGELPPGKIAGYVFQDGGAVTAQPGVPIDVPAIRDGKRTADDTPLAGVVLRLGDAKGLAILDKNGNQITTVTDANGYYEFNNLPPGQYTVYEDQPDGYIDGIDTPGTTGGQAGNKGGEVTPVDVVGPYRFDAIVQINMTAGVTSVENNFSEVRAVPPTQPEPQPPVFGLVATPTISPPAPGVAAYGLGAPQYQSLLPFAPRPMPQPVYIGGAGYLDTYSWHLSIIDAGTPRGDAPPDSTIVLSSSRFDLASWTGAPMNHGQWELTNSGETPRSIVFGLADSIPVVGDFNGDGITDIGVFADGEWFIDLNGNGIWDEDDLWVKLGAAGDLPITGDWDGDGKTDIGVYGPEWGGDNLAIAAEPGLPDPYNRVTGPTKNLPPKPTLATHGERTLKKTSHGNLRSDLIDHVFRYGVAGYVPVAGDWNGDGTDTIGVFFGGTWRLDTNGDGRWSEADEKFEYGSPGDLPIVGDFDGDGLDEVGVFRRGVWYIDQDHNRKLDPHDQVRELGDGNDLPVVGDWDGDGQEEPGLYKDGANNVPVQ